MTVEQLLSLLKPHDANGREVTVAVRGEEGLWDIAGVAGVKVNDETQTVALLAAKLTDDDWPEGETMMNDKKLWEALDEDFDER